MVPMLFYNRLFYKKLSGSQAGLRALREFQFTEKKGLLPALFHAPKKLFQISA
ncbi:MAG TPA: hypothetical protein VLT92_14660 [Burkholderiales bacterium]|nr:hypothetical protein [Burkholderiales bacterium]